MYIEDIREYMMTILLGCVVVMAIILTILCIYVMVALILQGGF